MMSDAPDLSRFVGEAELLDFAARARREDLGPEGLDVTSSLFIDETAAGEARFVARAAGVAAGMAALAGIAAAYDEALRVTPVVGDGRRFDAGEVLASVAGPMRAMLAFERVALNLLGRLTGIATLTAAYVDRCRGSRAVVLDTRKTTPTLRAFEKYAVACGGGGTHRMGLYDAVLLKDNHLAAVPGEALGDKVAHAVRRARADHPTLKFIEVEVDTLEQLDAVLPSGIDIVLLDNMTLDQLREAVQRRDALAAKVKLEASGGVNLDTIAGIAATGVDRISIGALTHAAVSLDIGLDMAEHLGA